MAYISKCLAIGNLADTPSQFTKPLDNKDLYKMKERCIVVIKK